MSVRSFAMVAVAAFLGVFVAHLLDREPARDLARQEALAPPTLSDHEDLLLALQEIRDAIGRLDDLLLRSRDLDRREPADVGSTQGDPAGSLARSIEDLRIAIEHLRARAETAPGGVQALRLPDGPADPAQLTKLRELTNEQLHREHLLLTPQQVLDLYGRPDSVWGNYSDGIRWTYPSDEGVSVHFWFTDGLVVGVGKS